MNPLEKITERVCRNGHPDNEETPVPLLTLSEFFIGNDVEGSIGCNLDEIPKPSEFYSLLNEILKRSDVSDIRVQITAFDAPDWPFTDTIYIMTSNTEAEVESWFPEHMKPDDVWEGFTDLKFESYEIPIGTHPVAVWWD